MAKTVVSTFSSQEAARICDSVISSGFDFSVINPEAVSETPLDTFMHDVPRLQAQHYQKHLRRGDSLLVARVSDNQVACLIKLLQSTGGHWIEAFDTKDGS